MGAALSTFVLLSLSVFIIQVASVALRVIGLSGDTSRFQALSVFTGTGFTTTEAESRASLGPGDWLVMVGNDDEHERLERIFSYCTGGRNDDSPRQSAGETTSG